jgi:hypothetical protein
MTDSELTQLRIYGYTQKEISNFRKVAQTGKFMVSNSAGAKNIFTLDLPQEARFFLGLRRTYIAINESGLGKPVTVNLNQENIIEDTDLSLFQGQTQTFVGGLRPTKRNYQYIDVGRKLIGKDNLQIILPTQSGDWQEIMTWFYIIDITEAPKQGK